MLTLCCSRKGGEVLRLRPRRAAKFTSPDLDKAARLFSWAGASVSFSVLVKAILRAEMPSALFRAVSPFPHVKSSRLKAAQRRMISKGRHLLLELVPKGHGDLTLALRSA